MFSQATFADVVATSDTAGTGLAGRTTTAAASEALRDVPSRSFILFDTLKRTVVSLAQPPSGALRS